MTASVKSHSAQPSRARSTTALMYNLEIEHRLNCSRGMIRSSRVKESSFDFSRRWNGPNPLGNIQRLVRENSLSCTGQRPETTQIYWWGGTQNLDQDGVEWEASGDDSHSPSRSSPSSSESTSAESSYTGPVPSVGSTSRTPSASPSVSLSVNSTSASSTSTTKKTACTETERRLTLETDKWALRVTPHEVDCRGCCRTIKLDRRSRYYPGLWEKRHNQCKAIGKLRETENVPGEPIPFDAEFPESSSSGSDPTLLAPRKSYYRKHLHA